MHIQIYQNLLTYSAQYGIIYMVEGRTPDPIEQAADEPGERANTHERR